MAAASDVPPEVRRFCTAALAAARSALGSDVVSAPWSKPTTPMSTVSGWASMNASAVCCAAASRLGATSSALMLLDTSIARMTVPALRPTGSAAAGPATATASTTTPARENHSPSWRWRRPATETPAAARAADRRRPATHGADDQRGGDQQAEDEQRRVGEAHRVASDLGLGDDRQQRLDEIAAGVDAVQRHPGPAHAGPQSGLALVDAVAEAGAEPRIGGVDEQLLAGLGVLDHDQADLGERVVRGVDHPQRDDVVAVREPDERALPLARADEVRDHHDQAAPRQRRDRVEHRGEVGGGRGPGVGGAVELPSDPQRVAASGAGRDDAGRAGVVEDGADPVAVSAEQPGQDEGELGEHVLLAAARAADHHGRRSVEDQPGGQLAVLVELAYLRFVEPGGDVPVDVPGVVAFVVRPRPRRSRAHCPAAGCDSRPGCARRAGARPATPAGAAGGRAR